MGQRLVINIIKDNKRIANIYYHWSAYSISALEEARRLIDSGVFDESYSVKELQLKLVRLIESFGGCIDGGKDSEEYQKICDMFPNKTFKETGDRNEGLIALSDDGMDKIEGWAEGIIDINLDEGMIYNSVFCCETLDEFNKWREEDNKLEDFNEVDIEISEIKFENIEETIRQIEILPYTFRQGDMIYELIG